MTEEWDQKFLQGIRMMKAMVNNMNTKGQPVLSMEITDSEDNTKMTIIVEKLIADD